MTPEVERWILVAIKEFGIIAVPIFLFIAGSFFVYAAQGKTVREGYKQVWKGLQHIIPPYLLWSMVYYLVVYFLFAERYDIFGYLHNLIVGYPFNFVPLLVAFYLAAPLMVWVAKRYPWLLLAVFLFYQTFLIVVLRPELFGFILPGWVNYFAPPVLRLSLAIWGIFYPLGLVVALHSMTIVPMLKRLWWLIALVGSGLFILAVLTSMDVINQPLAAVFGPLFGILLFPIIKREHIPFTRWLETLGKRSYGLYLTNLSVLKLLLALVSTTVPWLFSILSLLAILLTAFTLALPQLFMAWVERGPGRKVYRFAFG